MLVELGQLLLEVKWILLVLMAALTVLVCPHLAVISTVVFQHISERRNTFGLSYKHFDQNLKIVTYIDLIKFLNEGESSSKICLERQHLCVIFKADVRNAGSKGHIVHSFLVRQF